jgi:hypothetical protein
MWAIAFGMRASHWSTKTGLPESAWKVIGVTKRVADSVIATWTSAPFNQQAYQLGRLVGSNTACHTEHNALSFNSIVITIRIIPC